VVSGGHTHIVHVKDYGEYEILGKTRDDAAGEAYDKVARTLGLGYPGGPKIDKIAKEGNPEAIAFPRIYLEKDSLDFSFSGIKSSVINYVHNCKQKNIEIHVPDLAASFQASVVEVLTEKLIMAAKKAQTDTVVLAGGVAANSALRANLEKRTREENLKFLYPSMVLCTDNAAMIGCAAYYDYKRGKSSDLYLNAVPNLKL